MAAALFRFLTGDVNWVDYGGKWYRRVGQQRYHIMELLNWREACGDDSEYTYNVDLAEVDLLATPASALADAYRSCSWDGDEDFLQGKQGELVKIECLHGYGHKAPLWDCSGNNYRKLMAEARVKSATLDDPHTHEAAMQRPVNAIGSTAREFAQGDIHSAMVRGVAAGDQKAKLLAKIYGVSDAAVAAAEATNIPVGVAFTVKLRPTNSPSAVPSDDPLAYTVGYIHAIAGRGLGAREDLAPEYIKGYHLGVDVKTGKAEKPEWVSQVA